MAYTIAGCTVRAVENGINMMHVEEQQNQLSGSKALCLCLCEFVQSVSETAWQWRGPLLGFLGVIEKQFYHKFNINFMGMPVCLQLSTFIRGQAGSVPALIIICFD